MHACAAVVLVAAFASHHALVAENAIAAGAVEIAFTTHRRFAPLTGPPFVVADRGPTVGTRHTVPIGKRYVRTVRVVRSQQVGNDHEKVE